MDREEEGECTGEQGMEVMGCTGLADRNTIFLCYQAWPRSLGKLRLDQLRRVIAHWQQRR